jgi:adenosylcobyric acid synthase
MVCGTASNVGKTQVVTGLCRLLARRGTSVAPFKAQNMALNSYVTPSGHEIGRAQGAQALAAGIEPTVEMNPILLKPTGERTSQVIVLGEPVGHLDAAAYHECKPTLLATVLDALATLRTRHDVVLVEGAGSPAEINLLAHDLVNLRIAHEASLPAIVVGDIDRGGVFAALYGTVMLLPDALRERVRGFVINKFRGDPALLGDGLAELERRCGMPTLGVLPWVHNLDLDAEDSLALEHHPRAVSPALGDPLDIVAVRFPRMSNFTDLDALTLEPGVSVRLVTEGSEVGCPDLVILPGTKATVADLEWLRGRGLDRAIAVARSGGALILGICGGFQMLGRRIVDPIESGRGEVAGLGWLDVDTTFSSTKVTRQRCGHAMGQRVGGYEIHHGHTRRGSDTAAWIHLDDVNGADEEGAVGLDDASILGTSLHGLFEQDGFRAAFLVEIGRRRGKQFVPGAVSFAAARSDQFDRLADLLETYLDLAAVERLIEEGACCSS